MKQILAALFCFFAPSLAFAQGALLQGGPWTQGHAPMYVGQGSSQAVVQDSGPAGGGAVGVGLGELLQVNRGTGVGPFANTGTGPLGTHGCLYDNPVSTANYHFLCFDANAQGGGLVAYGAGGTASPLPFQFIVNGSVVSLSGPILPVVANDVAIFANTTGQIKDSGVSFPSVVSAGNPLIGGSVTPGQLVQGTRSGTTTEFATVSGSLTSGDCALISAGNIVDAGSSACGLNLISQPLSSGAAPSPGFTGQSPGGNAPVWNRVGQIIGQFANSSGGKACAVKEAGQTYYAAMERAIIYDTNAALLSVPSTTPVFKTLYHSGGDSLAHNYYGESLNGIDGWLCTPTPVIIGDVYPRNIFRVGNTLIALLVNAAQGAAGAIDRWTAPEGSTTWTKQTANAIPVGSGYTSGGFYGASAPILIGSTYYVYVATANSPYPVACYTTNDPLNGSYSACSGNPLTGPILGGSAFAVNNTIYYLAFPPTGGDQAHISMWSTPTSAPQGPFTAITNPQYIFAAQTWDEGIGLQISVAAGISQISDPNFAWNALTNTWDVNGRVFFTYDATRSQEGEFWIKEAIANMPMSQLVTSTFSMAPSVADNTLTWNSLQLAGSNYNNPYTIPFSHYFGAASPIEAAAGGNCNDGVGIGQGAWENTTLSLQGCNNAGGVPQLQGIIGTNVWYGDDANWHMENTAVGGEALWFFQNPTANGFSLVGFPKGSLSPNPTFGIAGFFDDSTGALKQFALNTPILCLNSDIISSTCSDELYVNPSTHFWTLSDGATPTSLGVCNTIDNAASPTNYECGYFSWASNTLTIGTKEGGTGSARAMNLQTGGVVAATIDTSQNLLLATAAALATTATSPFGYLSTTAGAPTGTPGAASAGRSAIVIDSTNHKICWYESANTAWKCATGS